MKNSLLALLLFIFQYQSFAKTPEETFLAVLDYSKNESPFSMQINWEDIKARGLDFLQGKSAPCAATSAIANILVPALSQLDHHSFVTLDGLNTAECPLPAMQNPSEAMAEWSNLDSLVKNPILEYSSHFHGKRIGDYSYIYIPAGYAWEQNDINKRIKEGRKAFENARVRNSKGIILDFRHNWGGNNVPMLLAVSALLPDDVIFKFSPDLAISLESGGNKLTRRDKDNINEYGRYDSSIPVKKVSRPTIILINGLTGSSGAISAFSLKNSLAQSLIVGEASEDSLSVTESYLLPDGNYYNLLILRIFNKYNLMAPLKLDVDDYVEHDYKQMFRRNDPQIQRALFLLSSQG